MPQSDSRLLNQLITVGTTAAITVSTETIPATKPVTVAAIPGSGGTLAVAYQLVSGGTWHNWPAGTVSTATVYLLTGPVYALKFTATTNPGVVEIAQ